VSQTTRRADYWSFYSGVTGGVAFVSFGMRIIYIYGVQNFLTSSDPQYGHRQGLTGASPPPAARDPRDYDRPSVSRTSRSGVFYPAPLPIRVTRSARVGCRLGAGRSMISLPKGGPPRRQGVDPSV